MSRTLKSFVVAMGVVAVAHGTDFGSESVTMWEPYLEWEISGVSYSGNAYDVIATVTFEHGGSNARHETEMFFDGNDTWKFRFTGTKTGTWSFSTSSDNGDLNGHSGEVSVSANADNSITGFMVASGSKFAVQTGAEGDLKAIPGHVFKPWDAEHDHARPDEFLARIDNAMASARTNGFTRVFLNEMCNGWFKLGAKGWDDHDSDEPDRATFEALEQIIVKLHRNGLSLHIWAWGDDASSRRWTPKGVAGGLNGYADRRVQRYIAARLGPLPGWTMGYGFDLQEWVGESELKSWAEYMHQRMGWSHLLCARGRSNSALDVVSYSHLCHDYNTAVGNLNRDPNRPHFFEERDLYKRSCADFDWTRHHVWRYTMAGGHAGFFGAYWTHNDKYPHPEYLRAHHAFWYDNERLLLDMKADNGLTDGYCLITPGKTHAVFYKENTDKVSMNLSGFNGTLSAVAVDAKKEYGEIGVDVTKSDMTWSAPNSSDWVIAVGGFGGQPADNTPPSAPSNLNASAAGNSQVDLSWDAASDGESGISGYNVYRGGTSIGTTDNTSYSDKGLDEGAEYTYRVSAVNGAGMEGEKSGEASAATGADDSPPEIASVAAAGSATTVTVVFSEPVEKGSAEETGNYSIDNDVSVSGASLGEDGKTVTLTTSQLSTDITYTLAVGNVKDLASTPNTIAAGTEATFSFLPYTQGEVAYQYYEGSFETLPEFDALTPARTGTVSGFDIAEVAGTASNYAIRFSGMVEIGEDGEYTFGTTSDDGSALYVDGDKVVDNDGLHGMEQKAGTITLTAGMHPIVVTFFQAGGGQGLEVTWQAPGSGSPGQIPLEKLYASDPDQATVFDVARGRVPVAGGAISAAPGPTTLSISGLNPSRTYRVHLVDLSGRILGTTVVGGVTEAAAALPTAARGVLLVKLQTGSSEWSRKIIRR